VDYEKINPKKLEVAKIRTMSNLGMHVTWGEFARMLDLTPNTLSNLRHGKTAGSVTTLQKIAANLQKHGVDMKEEDLIT
jgi:transcriptional regulator with XRE-family HTH domain